MVAGDAILKLNPASYPQLVENEHFFMAMASAFLRVANTTLLHDSRSRSALLVDRFYRATGDPIAQEDACQVADVYPASKYRIKTTATYKLATLMALIEHCVENLPANPADTLQVPIPALAHRMLDIYWHQVRPFDGHPRVVAAARGTYLGQQAGAPTWSGYRRSERLDISLPPCWVQP